ncbi:MAG: TetR/AcrR family transcriptional regulator [Dermatophilaceae bacterium]|nr:TetR/AcrR family transcriptional regulator [Dermatophilaceae bacterium]MBP9918775.1 TetR/AcrR family transcriptional regulator [Dermatophilaceae bacterium]
MPRIDAPTVAEHNAMRRRQVVDAAALVLSEVGAAAFTPAAVAKQAGLARSSMYQYYPSTDALLGAAVAEMLERSRDRMIAAVAAADTPAERVTAYVREAIDDATSGHATIPDLSGMHMPEVCREGVRALHDELLAPLRAALQDAEVDNPEMASVLVRGLVNAAVSAAKHGAPREALTTATIDFVLRGVGLRA